MVSKVVLACVGFVTAAGESLRFAHSYGSDMVLQQGPKQSLLWGYAVAGAEVTVSLRGESLSHDVRSTAEGGIWRAVLPAVKGSMANYTISASDGTDTVELSNVLFGDVWVCSGQSNMAFLLEMDLNGTALVEDADNYPSIRLFTSKKIDSETPLAEQPAVEQPWAVGSSCSVSQNCGQGRLATTVGDDDWLYMSAVCWLFGREVQRQTGLPVGLVNTNWGGTKIQFWSSSDARSKCPVPGSAGGAWNGMVTPLLNMTVHGAIWYQGEGNAGDDWLAHEGPSGKDELPLYACRFPSMIEDWRAKWHQGTGGLTDLAFPFGFVQLAGYGSPGLNHATLRWAQTAGFGSVPNARMPNTFMAVAMDMPDHESPYGDVHIRHKQDIGLRLGLAARGAVYGANVSWQPPRPSTAEAIGGSVAVTFDQPLRLGQAQPEIQFEICQAEPCQLNATSGWVNATASAQNHVLHVQASEGSTALALRYAWSNVPCEYRACALYAQDADLPVAPFFLRLQAQAIAV